MTVKTLRNILSGIDENADVVIKIKNKDNWLGDFEWVMAETCPDNQLTDIYIDDGESCISNAVVIEVKPDESYVSVKPFRRSQNNRRYGVDYRFSNG